MIYINSLIFFYFSIILIILIDYFLVGPDGPKALAIKLFFFISYDFYFMFRGQLSTMGNMILNKF